MTRFRFLTHLMQHNSEGVDDSRINAKIRLTPKGCHVIPSGFGDFAPQFYNRAIPMGLFTA